MSSDPAGTAPMTDERPMGVLSDPNEDRALHATLAGTVYARHPVRTHLVTAADDAAEVVGRYVGELDEAVRLVAVSERMVAITQGRSYPIVDIRPGRLARFLERRVTRPGYGIGLGSAETMQLAIDEVGAAAHPAGDRGLRRHEAVRGPRDVLPGGGAAGEGHRRADLLHHPALQPGRDTRPQGPRRRGPHHRSGHWRARGDHRRQRRRMCRPRREPRRRPPLRRAAVCRQPAGAGPRADPDRPRARGRLARR